jgi:hypothetical protein
MTRSCSDVDPLFNLCLTATRSRQLQAMYNLSASRAQKARKLIRAVLLFPQDGIEACQFHLDADFEEIVETLGKESEIETR